MSDRNGETRLRADYTVQGGDFNRGGEVSTDIKARLKQIGFEPDLVRRVAIASFEAEMNVIMYAERADVQLEVAPERITVRFRDKGPGIPDIELAMQEGYSTATPEMRKLGFGAGMGLPTIKQNADHFTIESKVGQGTVVKLFFAP
jgi:anti-sigma regulatory factor (Ser/Thr protein kinase)